MLSTNPWAGLAGKRRYENKTLEEFQLNVTLDKVINSNILIAVTQPPFTKNLGLPSSEKNALKLAT
jgi:hypothetical protein